MQLAKFFAICATALLMPVLMSGATAAIRGPIHSATPYHLVDAERAGFASCGSQEDASPLKQVYETYLQIKDALVQKDAKSASVAAKALLAEIEAVDLASLNDGSEKWLEIAQDMSIAAERIAMQTNVERQRAAFSQLTAPVYTALKAFGHTGRLPMYYQYCPMAFDNEGAYWLSAEEQIANPYFGDRMLRCGTTKESFQSN